ncbi:hypothetical protein ACFV06_05900 [Streptomyces sp. NPDC059618]|uniref:hypothetical protein n=1 Tax=unclassified Streptomyces TaxID=2593676 RepID=UPI0036624E36
MNSNTTTRKHVRRTAIVAGLVAAVALPLGLTASAQATPVKTVAASAAQRTVTGRLSDNLTLVADFYGAYIDAHTDSPNGRLATDLRTFYIGSGYRRQLAAWEDRNHADGVLRAQNIPVQWTVKDLGAAGHAKIGVTLTWSAGRSTRLVVGLDRHHKIVRIDGN